MQFLSTISAQNTDVFVSESEVIAEDGDDFSLAEILRAPPLREVESFSAFCHIQSQENNDFELLEELPAGFTVFKTANALLIRASEAVMMFEVQTRIRSAVASKLRITFGFFRRGKEWLRDNWRCEACKLAVRALLNAGLTSAGIPSPDLLDILPVLGDIGSLDEFLNSIHSMVGENHPVAQALEFLGERLRLRPLSINKLVQLICEWLGFCLKET
ncbi:MAG: hypothetical protein ABJL57_16430 [Hyphomonas sp.]|uniref:hypothetical protein n=1 Tax=Hyphomonas sp. TaxID=87 RepID=UPI003263EDAC